MARTSEIDALLKTYQESLAFEQTNLAEITQALARTPGDLELRRKMREKRGYIDEVTQEITDLTAARQVIIDQANSEEGLAVAEARKKALAVFIDHADNKMVAAGRAVDMSFYVLMDALYDWRRAREETHAAWGKHFGKLNLDGETAENVGFLSRMHLGDCSPNPVAALAAMVLDLVAMSGLNVQEHVKVNLYGYQGFNVKRNTFPNDRKGWTMEYASDAMTRSAKHRAIEHEARYG